MATVDEQNKLVETLCRRYLSVPWVPISRMQRESSVDVPARGSVWISRTTFFAPTDTGLRDALFRVCERLKDAGQSSVSASDLPLEDVVVEFIGSRAGVDGKATEPDISEQEKLKSLERECQSSMTVLYIHGGGL